MKNEINSNFFNDIPKSTEIFVNKCIEISDRIEYLLNIKKISQREFASMLGKEESEISKWLSGTHNFTLKTLTKIENILNANIIRIISNYEFIVQLDSNSTLSFNLKNLPVLKIESSNPRVLNFSIQKKSASFTSAKIHNLELLKETANKNTPFCSSQVA